jgi:hypothetical protein
MAASKLIAARVASETKARFHALAEQQQIFLRCLWAS